MFVSLKLVQLAYFLAAVWLVFGDVYMHNPRGSNNRLNERSANRRNANRMFDSQNNNRGGYNAGDKFDNNGFNSEDQEYYMKMFQSGLIEGEDSFLQIEWTNQHGCGGNEDNDPHKLNCNIVLQYLPQTYDLIQAVANSNDEKGFTRLRNGANTQTQTHTNVNQNGETYSNFINRRRNSVHDDRGLHEIMEFYDDCTTRSRNKGLFTADQQLRGNTAKFTRQNPNGNRRGYECPEERDYYPYWHPTPWRDIAILTDNISRCDYYQSESFNVKPKQHCRENYADSPLVGRHWSKYNNRAECEQNSGTWFTEYGYIDIDTTAASEGVCSNRNTILTRGYSSVWAYAKWGDSTKQCLILGPAPQCLQVGWSRVNHNGNGRDGVPLNYTWRLPHFLNNVQKLAVVRIRYNISTDDYDPWMTDSTSNQLDIVGRQSPVQQNPNVNIGISNNKPLRLAINTAQFGRTFQDRSHVIHLRSRDIIRVADRGCRIINLNVRGKRGNIVQVYPAVEYDFIPNRMEINDTDCVHIQWTGSNTHNNKAPGGDGQTGDAGEGDPGTDRHNMVETPNSNSNYPCLGDKTCAASPTSALFKDAEVVWASFDTPISKMNLELAFASGGYYTCLENSCTDSVESKTKMQQLLNNVTPSFEGALLKFKAGTYYYICSRNNNFTNRSEKGMLKVKQRTTTK